MVKVAKQDHTKNNGYYPFAIGVVLVLGLIEVLLLASKTESSVSFGSFEPAVVYNVSCGAHSRCKKYNNSSGDCCPDPSGKLLDCCDPIPSALAEEEKFGRMFFGIGYNPIPYKEKTCATDDFMNEYMEPFWGERPKGESRDDLKAIKALGFKVVQVYGHISNFDASKFLDRAKELGLMVIVSFSPYAFSQCKNELPYDCFNVTHTRYSEMLQNGFSKPRTDGRRNYHKAIKAIVLMNEPEFLIGAEGSFVRSSRGSGYYTKALLSAFDAVLDAEEQFKIVPDEKGNLPPFTATFSSSTCQGEDRGKAARQPEWRDTNRIRRRSAVASTGLRNSPTSPVSPLGLNEDTTATPGDTKATTTIEADTEATTTIEADTEATTTIEADTEATTTIEADTEATTTIEADTEATTTIETDTEATTTVATDTEATTTFATYTEATTTIATNTEASTTTIATDTEATTTENIPASTFTTSTTGPKFDPTFRCISAAKGNEVILDGQKVSVGAVKTIPFMYDFVLGALRPSLFGYTVKGRRDALKYGLQNRFVFSHNSEVSPDQACLDLYQPLDSTPLAKIPRFVAGFSNGEWTLGKFKSELNAMKRQVKGVQKCGFMPDPPLHGMIMKGFQKEGRLDKIGVYELGSRQVGTTLYGPDEVLQPARNGTKKTRLPYAVWCLRHKRAGNEKRAEDSFPYNVKLIFDQDPENSGALIDDSSCPQGMVDPEIVETV